VRQLRGSQRGREGVLEETVDGNRPSAVRSSRDELTGIPPPDWGRRSWPSKRSSSREDERRSDDSHRPFLQGPLHDRAAILGAAHRDPRAEIEIGRRRSLLEAEAEDRRLCDDRGRGPGRPGCETECGGVRIGLAAVGQRRSAPRGRRRRSSGGMPGPPAFADAAKLASEEGHPASDLRGSEEYKRAMIEVFTRRAPRNGDGAAGR